MRRAQPQSFPRVAHGDEPPRCVLKHLMGSRSGKVDVLSGSSIMIGRGEQNDVPMDLFGDPTISAHHAEIRWENGEFVLYDMGSLNGTFLNGQPIRRAVLTDNDVIGLGRTGARMAFERKMAVSSAAKTPRSNVPQVSAAYSVSTSQEAVVQEVAPAPIPRDSLRPLLIIVAVLAFIDAVLHILDLFR